MYHCSIVLRGNIISWRMDNFVMNNVNLKQLENSSILCNKVKTHVIFPKKVSFKAAETLCQIHGGKLVVPESSNEEGFLVKLANTHNDSCLIPSNNLQKGKALWLGMTKMDSEWYFMNSSSQLGSE